MNRTNLHTFTSFGTNVRFSFRPVCVENLSFGEYSASLKEQLNIRFILKLQSGLVMTCL